MKYALIFVLGLSITNALLPMNQFTKLFKKDKKDKNYETFNYVSVPHVSEKTEAINYSPSKEIQNKVHDLCRNSYNVGELKELFCTHKLSGDTKFYSSNYSNSYVIPIEWAMKHTLWDLVAFLLEEKLIELKPEYIDSLCKEDRREYSQRGTITEEYTILKKFVEAKIDINKEPKEGRPLLARYIENHWRIMEKNDPIIALCMAQNAALCDKNNNLFSRLLFCGYQYFMSEGRCPSISYLFSPNNDIIPQCILVLKELCLATVKNTSEDRVDALKKLALIMQTKVETIGSPQQCIVRLDEAFSKNNELQQLIFNTQEYVTKALEDC